MMWKILLISFWRRAFVMLWSFCCILPKEFFGHFGVQNFIQQKTLTRTLFQFLLFHGKNIANNFRWLTYSSCTCHACNLSQHLWSNTRKHACFYQFRLETIASQNGNNQHFWNGLRNRFELIIEFTRSNSTRSENILLCRWTISITVQRIFVSELFFTITRRFTSI